MGRFDLSSKVAVITGTAVSLAAKAGSGITGQCIAMDGGMTIASSI